MKKRACRPTSTLHVHYSCSFVPIFHAIYAICYIFAILSYLIRFTGCLSLRYLLLVFHLFNEFAEFVFATVGKLRGAGGSVCRH